MDPRRRWLYVGAFLAFDLLVVIVVLYLVLA
jgi:hypothetical protein